MKHSERTIIPKMWDTPAIIKRRMGMEAGRQRLMDEEGHLFAILHQLPTPEDQGHREPVMFWRNPDGDWKSIPTKGGIGALRAHVECYLNKIRELDEELANTHQAETIFKVIEAATPIHRAARNMMLVLQKLREALPDDQQILAIRDLGVEAEIASELLVSDAKSALDFSIALSTARQADASYDAAIEAQKLNRIAACFFPIATLAAIFSMNRPGIVLGHFGYYIVIFGGLILGLLTWSIVIQKNHKKVAAGMDR